MHVVSTTAVAAACASPFQEAGSAPVPKTKYWTLQTTPAAKVGGRMLRVCVVRTNLERFELQTLRGRKFFFFFCSSSHFCRPPEEAFSGSKPGFSA